MAWGRVSPEIASRQGRRCWIRIPSSACSLLYRSELEARVWLHGMRPLNVGVYGRRSIGEMRLLLPLVALMLLQFQRGSGAPQLDSPSRPTYELAELSLSLVPEQMRTCGRRTYTFCVKFRSFQTAIQKSSPRRNGTSTARAGT